jgi:hypothetical protein
MIKIKNDTTYQYDSDGNLIRTTVTVTEEPIGWISVRERMPLFGKYVFVYDAATSSGIIGSCRYDISSWMGIWHRKGSSAEINPTHWRELSDPPEGL